MSEQGDLFIGRLYAGVLDHGWAHRDPEVIRVWGEERVRSEFRKRARQDRMKVRTIVSRGVLPGIAFVRLSWMPSAEERSDFLGATGYHFCPVQRDQFGDHAAVFAAHTHFCVTCGDLLDGEWWDENKERYQLMGLGA